MRYNLVIARREQIAKQTNQSKALPGYLAGSYPKDGTVGSLLIRNRK